jgi:hypothetical protein
VFVGGVLCTLSAWVIMEGSFVARVRAGAEADTSPRLAYMVPRFMAKTSVVPRKRRGPPPTGKGVQVGERWHPSELAAIDAWIAASNDKTLTRAHAIRRLVALGLRVKTRSEPSELQRAAIADLASQAIDSLTAGVANNDEKASRKRRLIKGPEEFREARVDRPKAKGKS